MLTLDAGHLDCIYTTSAISKDILGDFGDHLLLAYLLIGDFFVCVPALAIDDSIYAAT